MATNDVPAPATKRHLRRVLTLGPLTLYGLGVIIGAGVYVATGTVIHRAGDAAPLAFLLAGIAAALTGLCYAEMAVRFPEASGSVAFVRHGFGSPRLAQITGAILTVTVVLATASIARGAVHYLLVLLPVPAPILMLALIAGFTAIALRGVRESVWLAAGMSVVEIGGLLAATAAGLASAPDYRLTGMIPGGLPEWGNTLAGAFVAFFAFLGFETLANLGEEVRDPQRTLPRGILGAVAASILLYVAVAVATVLADRGGDNPLLDLFEGRVATAFAIVAAIAVANGVLVQIVMLARLFYGMACNAQLPAMLGRVSPRSGTPAPATLLAGGLVLLVALAVPFEPLLVLTNGLTLCVFVLVDVALWRLHRTDLLPAGRFAAPVWVPPVAASVAVLLILSELLL
jgi:APA family basic amino acid/polyamine antiporter